MAGDLLIVLSGPTASGKSAAALSLARRFRLEIVNVDSMQVYRGMDIGTAKPTPADRGEVPHHLIDVADPDEEYSAGRYVTDARAAIEGVRRRGRVPLVVGGTGMYIRALLRGLDPLPSDAAVRSRLLRRWEDEGAAVLHRELVRIDPATAARVHPADRIRVLRGLEIAEITGLAPSAARVSWGGEAEGPGSPGKAAFPYRTLFMALDPGREAIRRRVDARVAAMFREGLVEEVRLLLDRGYGASLKSMKSLGYRHVVAHLLGGVSLAEAVAEMKRDTRRYAKRQMTWLAREPEIQWIRGDSPLESASDLVRKILF